MPCGRHRRNLNCIAIVFFNTGDLLTQLTLERGKTGEIAAHNGRDTLEFAFDITLADVPPVAQQHGTIALHGTLGQRGQ